MRRLRLIALGATLALAAPVALPAAVAMLDARAPSASPATPPQGGDPGAVTPGEVAARVGAGLAPAAAAAVPPPGPSTAGFDPLLDRVPVGPAPTAPPVASLHGYRWPLEKGRITVDFGSFVGGTRVVDGARFHDGIDIATFCGDTVRAAHDGTVLAAGRRFDDFVGWVGDLAPYYAVLDAKKWWSSLPITVVVDDGNGYRSMYAHLSRATVRPGQHVDAGQRIGYEGATGNASGCHLHYGLFSPLATATFAIRADIVRRLAVPAREVARVDPARVLPSLPPGVTLGWGVSGDAWASGSRRLLYRRDE